MCGRFVSGGDPEDLADSVGAAVDPSAPGPSWNVAPTQRIRVVHEPVSQDTGEVARLLTAARWGLIPHWSKDVPRAPLINARSETVTSKPSFRVAASRHRVLVPAQGWYEWTGAKGSKQPWYLQQVGSQRLWLAGVGAWWANPQLPEDSPERWMFSVAVLTRPAPDEVGDIHDRAPIPVPADLHDDWLDPAATGRDTVDSLIAAIPAPVVAAHPVDPAVGAVRNNYPELITPIRL